MANYNIIHGKWKDLAYGSWASLKSRCLNPKNRAFSRYGGKGITVCERWLDIRNFLQDMGPKPSRFHSIERLDNTLGYQPGNCIWATRIEQQNNRKSNHLITFHGETKTVAQWARRLGMKRITLSARLRKGWNIERALTAPVRGWR